MIWNYKGKNGNELQGLLISVRSFSDDLDIKSGLEKCAKATIKKGKLVKSVHILLDAENFIKELDQKGTYKYLDVNEGDDI